MEKTPFNPNKQKEASGSTLLTLIEHARKILDLAGIKRNFGISGNIQAREAVVKSTDPKSAKDIAITEPVDEFANSASWSYEISTLDESRLKQEKILISIFDDKKPRAIHSYFDEHAKKIKSSRIKEDDATKLIDRLSEFKSD